MAKAIVDNQTLKVFTIAVGMVVLFSYGVSLAHDVTFGTDTNYIGSMDTSVEGMGYNEDKYEGDMSGEIVGVQYTEHDLGIFTIPKGEIPKGSIPKAEFRYYNVFDSSILDGGSWQNDNDTFTLWKAHTLWSSYTVWNSKTINFGLTWSLPHFTFDVNRFGDALVPDVAGDVDEMQNRLGNAPSIIVALPFTIITMGVILVIIKMPDISVA